MLRFLKRMGLMVSLVWMMLISVAFANVPTIAVEELRPGMTGYGKTVFQGTKIETFDVEVLGVTGSETGGYSILIRASGDNLRKNGGISQGMSGSPVYIDGRLAGAVAYGQAFSDPNYCFLTPINQMLDMLQEPDPRPSVFEGLAAKSTPLMVSGFTEDGLHHLNENLKPFGLTSYAVPTGADALSGVGLEPGSSVGVSLVRGDMNIGAIGTVTWVGDDGHILAFGHPFMQHGKSDYFMTNAYIYAAVPNIQSAFKVGSLGDTLGRITEDRLSGVAGKLGENAKIIPMYVSVTDMDRGLHQSTNVQLVTDEDLVPTLVDGVAYNAVSLAKDRKGGGKSRIRFTVTAQGEKEGPIRLRRENMFYSSKDIGKITNSELNIALDMLMNNRFDTVKIFDVNVDVETSAQCEVAELVSASFPNQPVVQGGDLPIRLTFKPYRAKEFTRTIHFKVPDKQKPGPMNLIVRSGNATQWLQNALNRRNQQNAGDEQMAGSMANAQREFKDFLSDFNTMDANNEIVVDLAQNLDSVEAKDGDAQSFASGVSTLLKGSPNKQKYTMDFIISGETGITVQVKKR